MQSFQIRRHQVVCGITAILLLITGPVVVGADVTAIEEDWQLDLSAPNVDRSSPQLNCLISPVGNIQNYYAVFLINQHGSSAGGLELQLWCGDSLVSSSDLGTYESLDTPDERIRWTTHMELSNNGVLTVQILNGTSSTWGKFGDKTSLLVSAQTTLQNLNAYDPNITTDSSGVEFGSARVSQLILRKVRVYTSNKKSTEQALDRVVFQYK